MNDEEVGRFARFAKAAISGCAIGTLLPLIAAWTVFFATPQPTLFAPGTKIIVPPEIAVVCVCGCPCMMILGCILGSVGAKSSSPLLASLVCALITAIVVALSWQLPIIRHFVGPLTPGLLMYVSAGGALIGGVGALFSPEKKQVSIADVFSCLLPMAMIVVCLFWIYSTVS